MRGYFGIGVEGISKAMNLGALMRTAHAFGASFVFTVAAHPSLNEARKSDTSHSAEHVPTYAFASPETMTLPRGCALVGIELLEDAIDLPVFRHPLRAAYVLGREKGDLSPAMLARCRHVVKIPTRFCLNVGLAGALVMYDRLISLGRFGERGRDPALAPPPLRRPARPRP